MTKLAHVHFMYTIFLQGT